MSYLAASDTAAEVAGLDQVPKSEWPNVELTHLAFQVMVGSGCLLLVLSAWFWGTYLRRGAAILQSRALLCATAIAMPVGFIGLEAGWFVTEVGRQPWVIQGIMRTSDALTPADGVVELFVTFTLLYAVLGITVVSLLRHIAGGKAAT